MRKIDTIRLRPGLPVGHLVKGRFKQVGMFVGSYAGEHQPNIAIEQTVGGRKVKFYLTHLFEHGRRYPVVILMGRYRTLWKSDDWMETAQRRMAQ